MSLGCSQNGGLFSNVMQIKVRWNVKLKMALAVAAMMIFCSWISWLYWPVFPTAWSGGQGNDHMDGFGAWLPASGFGRVVRSVVFFSEFNRDDSH